MHVSQFNIQDQALGLLPPTLALTPDLLSKMFTRLGKDYRWG